MKRLLLLCVFCTLNPAGLRGISRESLAAIFAEANASYQKGDFATADHLYRQLLEKGVDSGALYYNLGNVCFKQKRLGEAIYFWEKARQKLPADPDIRENLELANLLVVDRIEVPAQPLPLRWLNSVLYRLTIAQDSWVVLMLFLVANALFSACLLARSRRWASRALFSAFAAAFLLTLFGCSLAWKVYEKSYRRQGVVVEQKAEIRSGPGMENITIFTVHEGILVRIRGETNGWYSVSLPNGWSGWLQKDLVRIL